jgi:putative oxidoreductase
MVTYERTLASWAPYLLSVTRIVAAALFMQHGAQKILGFPSSPPAGPPEMESLMWLAGMLELIGGGLLLVGLFTRPVAFVLSGQMAVAYFLVHAPQDFWPVLNQGELAILYCFTFLYFASAGGGAWSLDAWRGRETVVIQDVRRAA